MNKAGGAPFTTDETAVWVWHENQWCHSPRWKVMINRMLRLFQPQVEKWVIYTVCDLSTDPPTVRGYGFGPVVHRPKDRLR